MLWYLSFRFIAKIWLTTTSRFYILLRHHTPFSICVYSYLTSRTPNPDPKPTLPSRNLTSDLIRKGQGRTKTANFDCVCHWYTWKLCKPKCYVYLVKTLRTSSFWQLMGFILLRAFSVYVPAIGRCFCFCNSRHSVSKHDPLVLTLGLGLRPFSSVTLSE